MSKNEYQIFDAHADTLSVLLRRNESLIDSFSMVNARMLESYRAYLQVFACYVSDDSKRPLKEALSLIDKYDSESKRIDILNVRDGADVRRVFKEGRIGGILAVENGSALEGDIDNLALLYSRGVRLVTLTWNGANELGEGAYGEGGLTHFGKEVVRKMNEFKMVVDLSHLSRKGFWDACRLAQAPLVVSHSACRHIRDHPRNLTKEQIKELAFCRGVIGLSFYPEFLTDKKSANISDVVRHLEYILSVGGEDCVGIGSDFDGIPYSARGLESADKTYSLFDELKRLGYSNELIRKISYYNFARLFASVLE